MLKIALIMVLMSAVDVSSQKNNETVNHNIWNNVFKNLGVALTNCRFTRKRNESLLPIIVNCSKQIMFDTIKQILKLEDIYIFDGVHLVRRKENIVTFGNNSLHLEDEIMQTLVKFGDEYLLRIYLNVFLSNEEGRHRRGKHYMMSLMVFGIIGMGMFLVPMGFKFLAVLGGKALLLAKMALILSSIQGLKKVATSSLNYGLYHSPSVNPWHYERYGYDNLPEDQSVFFNRKV